MYRDREAGRQIRRRMESRARRWDRRARFYGYEIWISTNSRVTSVNALISREDNLLGNRKNGMLLLIWERVGVEM